MTFLKMKNVLHRYETLLSPVASTGGGEPVDLKHLSMQVPMLLQVQTFQVYLSKQ